MKMVPYIECSDNGTIFKGIKRDEIGKLIIPNESIVIRFTLNNKQAYCSNLSLVLGDEDLIDTTDLEKCVTPYTDGGASISALAEQGYSRFIPLNVNGEIINYPLSDQDSVLNNYYSLSSTATIIYNIINSGYIEYLNQIINSTIEGNQKKSHKTR